MRQILITLLFLLIFLPALAGNEEKTAIRVGNEAATDAFSSTDEAVDAFARWECSRENIIVGDSVQVNIVLYSSCPFKRAECSSKSLKIKGGHSRLVKRRGDRQQQRVRTTNGVYYAIVWDSYVVGSDKVEEVKFPDVPFNIEVEVPYGEEYYDPFDPFGFFHGPRRRTQAQSLKVKSPSFALPVIAKPKRSTQDAISSGSRIA